VQPVPVTVADLQSLSSLSAYGTLTWSTKPQPQIVLRGRPTLRLISGLDVPVIANLPKGVSLASRHRMRRCRRPVAVFTFDAKKAADAAATDR